MKTYEQRGHDNNKGDIFAYDGIYRLTGVKFNSPEPTNPDTEQFEKQKNITFDKLSNIMTIVESWNDKQKIISTEIPADSKYSQLNQYERFDQWGLSYDLNGNTTQKSTQHYVHDYRNRIVRATDVDSTVKFKYDALGRRIQKAVNNGTQEKTTNFFVLQYWGQASLTISTLTYKGTYGYDPNGNLVSMTTDYKQAGPGKNYVI